MPVEFLGKDSCVHCGRGCNNWHGGFASIGSLPVCHPNAPGRPDCYHMVTVYGHPTTDCTRCAEEPYTPLSTREMHDSMVDTVRKLELMIRDALP